MPNTDIVSSTAVHQVKNPSLRKYFKHMISGKKITIQFTERKIRQILKTDLDMDFNVFSDLLKDVCTETFGYYLQAWPGWQPTIFKQCIQNINEAFFNFKMYLKNKMLKLQLKEKDFLSSKENKKKIQSDNSCENELMLPSDILNNLPNSDRTIKIKLPYILQISGNANLQNAMCFEEVDGKIILHFNKFSIGSELTLNEVLNHPFVTVQFKIPLLINFMRRNVHHIEMFLCKPSDSWTFPSQDHIIDIQKHGFRSNIYTWKFMHQFFLQLFEVMADYDSIISYELKYEIKCICNEFLNDILEANLSSVQEGIEICYNIGKSVYYSDSAIKINEPINFRRIHSPQVLFNLMFCSILQKDVFADGSIKYFQVYKTHNMKRAPSLMQLSFIKNIHSSIHYWCTQCNIPYENVNYLKLHLRHIHPCEGFVKCTKCNKDNTMHNLLAHRWHHKCKS